MFTYIPFIHKLKRNKKEQPAQIPLYIEQPVEKPTKENAEERQPVSIELF